VRSVVAGLAAAILLGCGLLTFTVDEEDETTVPSGGVLGNLLGVIDLGGLDDMDVSIEQELADQGAEPGDLKSIELTRFDLHGDPDLGFLTSLDVYVRANGIPEALVASTGDVPAGQTDVSLDLEPIDLADQVIAGGLVFRIDAHGKPPAEETDIVADVSAEVSATAKGACNASKR
jgi:hypothetical protein